MCVYIHIYIYIPILIFPYIIPLYSTDIPNDHQLPRPWRPWRTLCGGKFSRLKLLGSRTKRSGASTRRVPGDGGANGGTRVLHFFLGGFTGLHGNWMVIKWEYKASESDLGYVCSSSMCWCGLQSWRSGHFSSSKLHLMLMNHPNCVTEKAMIAHFTGPNTPPL